MKYVYFSNTSTLLAVFLMGASMLVSCSKSGDPKPDPEPEPGTDVYYKVHRVENFAVEADDENPTQAKAAVLFDLFNKEEVPSSYIKTTRWDISFSELYNSFLGGNNGSNSNNVAYGGAGLGGVLILEETFEDVTDVPADARFNGKSGVIGTDDAGAFGEGTGWYLYDFGGSILGDGTEQKQHVAYALGSPLTTNDGTTIPARTVVVKTPKGDYAKIKMISCYKDAFTPDVWFKDTPHMFFTFEYVIVPAGSTKFEIKP